MTDQLSLPISNNTTTVSGYEFEPIKGYPILQWKGKRPFTSTQFFPAQLREVYGEEVDGWRNKIYWGDNLQVMSHLLRDFRGSVRLVYIDPPYDSKAEYKKTISLRGKTFKGDSSSFEEKQYTDIWTNDEYLQFMYERLVLIKELLAPNGSIFLHCDWHKSHHLRCLMDEVFGADNFLNEIVWCYYGPGSPGMRQFNRKHDNIFWYCKNRDWIFNEDEIRIPHDEKTIENFKEGLRGSGFVSGEYEIPQGKIPEDWWIMAIAGRYPKDGIKRVGYPTEKPYTLLERIIKGTTKPGDIVFDCFMGAGTTQYASSMQGRRFIGVDINLASVQITTKRLLNNMREMKTKLPFTEQQPGFEVYNVNNYDVFRNPLEAKDLLLNALEIQRFDIGNLFDGEKDGRLYKIMPVNRVASRPDLSELISGFDYKSFERRQAQHPDKPVEKITLVCMGHEPDLAANLKNEVLPYKLDVEVIDILRDKQDLHFKRDSEAKVAVKKNQLVVEAFYPMNLLQKLSLQQENVANWRELVESVMIDWNYDGAVLQPATVDIPEGNELVKGTYNIPVDAGTIRVKITDLLSESLEVEVQNG